MNHFNYGIIIGAIESAPLLGAYGKKDDYSKLFGNINNEDNVNVVAAKCRCVACNSCSCGRCILCIGQCTGCKSKDIELDLEWGMA